MYAKISENKRFMYISFKGNISKESSNTLQLKYWEDFIRVWNKGTFIKIEDPDLIILEALPGESFEEQFKVLLEEHKKNKDSKAINLDEKFIPPIVGTSKLIRKNNSGVISIAYRNPKNQKTSTDCVCIDNVLREEFFHDVKQSRGYQTLRTKKNVYEIERDYDDALYQKWSDIMDKEYARQYKINQDLENYCEEDEEPGWEERV